MKVSLRKCLLVQVACLGLWPILLFAQSPHLAQNLADCRNGRETCDPSKLSPSQSADVALAGHGRNVSNCRNGYDSCDHSKLTQQETIALALADHQDRKSTRLNSSHPSISYAVFCLKKKIKNLRINKRRDHTVNCVND